MKERIYRVLFPFGGSGFGALGFKWARARLFDQHARFEVVGGIDTDPMACKDFVYLTGAPSLCVPIEKMTEGDLRGFAGDLAPDVVFLSPPCKGASGLLSNKHAKSPKYRAMNGLALTWTRLMLATWAAPPRLVLLENVPRLKTRAKAMVLEYCRLLRRAGYILHEGFHDCGELGGLAQHRRRFLIVARLAKRVAPLLYQPPKMRVRACGEVLGELPMPGDPAGGVMHVLPRISWLNWVRLSLIPAGGDWRDLAGVLDEGEERRAKFKRHAVEAWEAPTGTISGSGSNAVANVADPRPFGNVDRVTPWTSPAGTVTSSPAPSSGAGAVADPRTQLPLPCSNNPGAHHNKYRVEAWDRPAHTVIGATRPGSGAAAIADPRAREWFRGTLGVAAWDEASGTVTGNARASTGKFSVADPRVKRAFDHGYGVLPWEGTSSTVAAGSYPGQGAYSIADPRLGCEPRAGSYGVLGWEDAAGTITGHTSIDQGRFAVADPRKPPTFVPMIVAADGTWHRPLTTLELAALQGAPTTVNGEPLKLSGTSHRGFRERIGNGVPPPAAQKMGEQMLITLLQADTESFALSSSGAVWVERANGIWLAAEPA